MTPTELFDIWAPPSCTWSKWAKPILFAELAAVAPPATAADSLPHLDARASGGRAIVVDLPAELSVKAGLALAGMGYRPVPLYNGNRGPETIDISRSAAIDTTPIQAWLVAGAAMLQGSGLRADAPPAFLLDSRRRPNLAPSPGRFDNRWLVFPQDFPSANFLKSQQISAVLLLQADLLKEPQEDLAHVLLRWQEAGLALCVATPENIDSPRPLEVKRPKRFRALWYHALAVIGFRRNSAGGFGSVVPQPSSSG